MNIDTVKQRSSGAKSGVKEHDKGARRRPVRPQPRRLRLAGLQQFFREVWQELSKVNWPSREDVVNWTLVTLAIIIIVAAYVAVLDFFFSRFLQLLGVL